jgi:hypothetical protein
MIDDCSEDFHDVGTADFFTANGISTNKWFDDADRSSEGEKCRVLDGLSLINKKSCGCRSD